MRLASIAVLVGVAVSTPVVAQEAEPDPNRDTVTIGAGAGYVPRYEGSSDYRIIPAAVVRGKVSGVSFTTQGTSLFVDLIPSRGGPGTKFVAGPMAHLTLNRSSRSTTRDPQIIALGRIPIAVELGGHVGISRTGLITSDYDNLTLDVAVSHDVTGTHDSSIVTPSISYGTPLSTRIYVGASVSADYVGDKYARRYFGIDNRQFLASGMPTYTPPDGFKDVNFGLIGALSLSGDLRRGLSLFAIGNYSRILPPFARSPIVRDRNQWFGGAGLAYTF